MIPFLASTEPSKPVEVPPPRGFRALHGIPQYVYVAAPRQLAAIGLTEAQKQGLRYEAKVQVALAEMFGKAYTAAPSVHFYDLEVPRVVVPDGILRLGSRLFVFEIKLQHMPEAWWQLRRLYVPVLSQLPFVHKVYPIEICRSFDPSMPFPEPTIRVGDLNHYVRDLATPSRQIGVYVCRL